MAARRPCAPARAVALGLALAAAGCAQASPDDETPAGRADAGRPATDAAPDRGGGQTCPDGDGDGFRTCDGDCDDRSPYVQPAAAELCDGVDNNCDGAIDEGFAGLGDPCGAGIGQCAAEGTLICAPDGVSVTCSAVSPAPTAETCNQLDDDCDGSVDEEAQGCCTAGETRPCGLAVGVCTEGTMLCGPDGSFGRCSGRGPDLQEVCNGLDDDCDGQTDEDVPDLNQNCDTHQPGVCSAGRVVCRDGAEICEPRSGRSDERCNGVDDDCDGTPDEGLRNAAEVCCNEATETCDGTDEDCDGRVDEGTARPDAICATSAGTYRGHVGGGLAGTAVHIVSDVDADGFADVLVGAPGNIGATPVPGAVYVLSGRTGRELANWAATPDDGELGASLAVADFTGDATDEWIVGVPGGRTDRARHGRVYVVDHAFNVLGRFNGEQIGSRFGASVAAGAVSPGGAPILVVGAPNRSSAAGRVVAYDLVPGAAGQLETRLRWNLLGARGQENLGANVGLAPPDPNGVRAVLAAHADDASPPENELLALEAAEGSVEAIYTAPSASAQTFGLGLSIADGHDAMAVGAWGVEVLGSTRGRAWLVNFDGEVLDVVDGPQDEAHLGFSTAVGAGLRRGAGLTWCAGAVADAFGQGVRTGAALCRTEAGAPVLTLAGDAPGDAFGWSLALGAVPDADGTYLLAVGAPHDAIGAPDGGAVHLFRLVAED